MLITCVATPIFIHGSLVFLRLYWFEKRFQNIVQDARNLRKTRTRSRTKSEARRDIDVEREDRRVSKHEIRVLRQEDGHAQGKPLKDGIDGVLEKPKENSIPSSSSTPAADDPTADDENDGFITPPTS